MVRSFGYARMPMAHPPDLSQGNPMEPPTTKATFTLHAVDRLREYAALNPPDVIRLLDEDKTLPVWRGKKDARDQTHRLFYSIVDHQSFIAVQDDENGEVITILLLDRSRCEVDIVGAVEQAKQLAGYVPAPPKGFTPGVDDTLALLASLMPTNVHVFVRCRFEWGAGRKRKRTVTVFEQRLPRNGWSEGLEKMLADECFKQTLAERIESHTKPSDILAEIDIQVSFSLFSG